MTNKSNNCFFILSCARSGSTSLAKILDNSLNGNCVIEPMPNLNRETRDMMDGRLNDPADIVNKQIVPRVLQGLSENEIYGEKNLTYGPFIQYLYGKLNCKFIFLKRDGRDVVSSLVNWHEQKFGTIYRECKYPGILSPLAISVAANLPVHLDTSDYSRPRPLKGDHLYDQWENLTREEMCAFYWSYMNSLYDKELQKLPSNAWIEIDYSNVCVNNILEIADFCRLKGLNEKNVQSMLNQRINSLEYRNAPKGTFPRWKDWDAKMRENFDKIASDTMNQLGYY